MKYRKTKSRVVLNVGGETYETYLRTLRRFPNTLLGNQDKLNHHLCPSTKQYFFNRSRVFFDAILFYYQSNGILSCPEGVPLELFINECHFYELPEDAIERLKPQEQQDLAQRERNDMHKVHKVDSVRSKVWDLLQNPETSVTAKTFSLFSLFLVAVAVMCTCLETVPSLQVKLSS